MDFFYYLYLSFILYEWGCAPSCSPATQPAPPAIIWTFVIGAGSAGKGSNKVRKNIYNIYWDEESIMLELLIYLQEY